MAKPTVPDDGDLQVYVGFASETGKRATNNDFLGAYFGTLGQRVTHGVVAAIADGIGGCKGGRVAAELAVRGFIDGYYSQPPTLDVGRAAAGTLDAINRWIHAQGRTDPGLEGMGTTFSALVLQGRRAHVLHVGDSRLYRWRASRLSRLTEDHSLRNPDLSHVLYRALGIEETVRLDHAVHAVARHDRFLLCSDGVHGVLSEQRLSGILAMGSAPEDTARRLVAEALAAGGRDNASALVVDVVGLPAPDLAGVELSLAELPIGELPCSGDQVDGFLLGQVLAAGRYSRLYEAEDPIEDRRVVLKFPHPRLGDEPAYRSAFLREIWIATRVRSPWLGEAIEVPPGRQTRLYMIMPHYEGETLAARLARRPRLALPEGVDIAIKLAKAVTALHRVGIIHRDIKPDNVILLPEGELKLLDFGVARIPKLQDAIVLDMVPGTASYMAPEMFAGQAGDESTDLYALAITIYTAFSGGSFPYGEIEPFSHPRFSKPTPLSHSRPDLPIWLEATLARAIAIVPSDRYGDLLEFIFDLEHGMSCGSSKPLRNRRPLYERNPVLVWQIVSLILLGLLLLVLAQK